jgi:RNA polymerase sigma-70 factor (ECF subfamily)
MDVETPSVTFHALYQRHARDVYRYALSLCADPAEADDIAAETFARCWSDFGRVYMPTVKAYLFTIARNLFLHSRRRRKHRMALDPHLEDRSNLAEQVEQKTEIEAAWRWLGTLPSVDKEVFLLRVVYELSYEEIAHIHGITVSAAKVKVHRARLKLIRFRAQQENA